MKIFLNSIPDRVHAGIHDEIIGEITEEILECFTERTLWAISAETPGVIL